MSLFDYEKEKQLQEDLENLFESKVRISKDNLASFLKKDEIPKEESTPVESEELKFVDVKDNVEPVLEVEKEESEDDIGFIESPKPKIMDRLLDEYEDNKESKEEVNEDSKVVLWGGGENNEIVTLGNGTSLYKDKSGSDLRFKSLSATGSTSITDVGDVVVISSTDVSGTDSWKTVSGDYYTSDEVDDLISAVSATSTVRITSADSPYDIPDYHIVIFANTDNQADVSANLPAGVQGRRVRITNTGTTNAGKVYLTPNGLEKLFGENDTLEIIKAETIEIYFDNTDGWW